jgi:hypothetical protein
MHTTNSVHFLSFYLAFSHEKVRMIEKMVPGKLMTNFPLQPLYSQAQNLW